MRIMRPALERLLSRPSSLELLQYLTGKHFLPENHNRRRRCLYRCRSGVRQFTAAAVAVAEDLENVNTSRPSATSDGNSRQPSGERNGINQSALYTRKEGYLRIHGPWEEPWQKQLSTVSQLDYESDLTQVTNTPKLLDPDQHGNDMALWALLLEHRYRKFGREGVQMFWDAVRARNVQLPTTSSISDRMWSTFLQLGFDNPIVLEQICQYADEIYDTRTVRWRKLYVRVIQHFLISGTGEEAIQWHERLLSRHPPGPHAFAAMCRTVVMRKGNVSALQQIYEENTHRNAYTNVINVLCDQEDFGSAVNWHMFFMKHEDKPVSRDAVDRLLSYLTAYDMPNAIKVTQSIADAGVSFAPSLSTSLKVTREMMNRIHGAYFKISPKPYNDRLGARWFATRWVSLDVAINSIHALGVEEIGPLSLQAIALREPEFMKLHERIMQLQKLGISVGSSVYSRAVVKFAHDREYENLESLLQSDQHPDTLEDSSLQEILLSTYAENKDWVQYRRTLSIQQLRSKTPKITKDNLILRLHARRGDTKALHATLDSMQRNGTPVSGFSLFRIAQYFRGSRRQGKKPISKDTDDIEFILSTIKRIAYSGSYIPPGVWREIMKRLGMLGRLAELEKLCLFLATWYSPKSIAGGVIRRHRLETRLPNSHPLHPLKIIFPASFQKALVEWGFIHALNSMRFGFSRKIYALNSRRLKSPGRYRIVPPRKMTFGIRILQKLFAKNVHINMEAVRKALVTRLTIYYGPGISTKEHNRRARLNLRLRYGRQEESYQEIISQLNDAFGANVWRQLQVPQLDDFRSGKVLGRVRRRQEKAVAKAKRERDRK